MNKCILTTTLLLLATFGLSLAEPNGAVLYRNGIRYGHYNVPSTAEHHYFNLLEGPAWENKYSAFRFYIDMDDRNALDITGKYNGEATLQDFSDPTADPHTDWSWGSDILSVGTAIGLGAFRLFINNNWVNPQLPETIDSLVITISDSSVQTPAITIGYYGWNIGSGNKIDAIWTISTTYETRPTQCELAITGNYSGKVVVGMVNHKENTNNPNRNSMTIFQENDPPLLATLGKQADISEGYSDSLLMAITTDKSYFDSFVKQGTTNLGMVLTPDADKKVKWSFAYSWAREASPLFRNPEWKKVLTATTHTLPHIRQVPSAVTTHTFKSPLYTNNFFTLSGKLLGSGVGSRNPLPRKATPGVYLPGKGKTEPQGRLIFPITSD